MFGGPLAVSVPRGLTLCDATPALGTVWVLLAPACEQSLPTALHPDFFPALHPDGHGHCPSFPPACIQMPQVCVLLQVSPSPRLGSSAPTWLLHVNAYKALHTQRVQTSASIPPSKPSPSTSSCPGCPMRIPKFLPYPPCHCPPTTAAQPLWFLCWDPGPMFFPALHSSSAVSRFLSPPGALTHATLERPF